jgi:cytochrome P450
MALKSHNDEFVLQRKLTHVAFSAEAVKKYIPMQEDMAANFAAKLIDDPKHFREHVQRYVTSRIGFLSCVTICMFTLSCFSGPLED